MAEQDRPVQAVQQSVESPCRPPAASPFSPHAGLCAPPQRNQNFYAGPSQHFNRFLNVGAHQSFSRPWRHGRRCGPRCVAAVAITVVSCSLLGFTISFPFSSLFRFCFENVPQKFQSSLVFSCVFEQKRWCQGVNFCLSLFRKRAKKEQERKKKKNKKRKRKKERWLLKPFQAESY
mgnify:CR=1 FL=1